MHNQYRINIQLSQQNKHFSQQRAMHIMACIFLFIFGLQFFFHTPIDWNAVMMYIFPVIGMLYVSLWKKKMLQEKSLNMLFRILESALLFSASMYYMQLNKISISILFAIISFSIIIIFIYEHYYVSNQYIYMNTLGVTIPNHFKRTQKQWHELENVILYANVFTIIEKNKSPIQKNIQLQEHIVTEINNFCMQHLNKA